MVARSKKRQVQMDCYVPRCISLMKQPLLPPVFTSQFSFLLYSGKIDSQGFALPVWWQVTAETQLTTWCCWWSRFSLTLAEFLTQIQVMMILAVSNPPLLDLIYLEHNLMHEIPGDSAVRHYSLFLNPLTLPLNLLGDPTMNFY